MKKFELGHVWGASFAHLATACELLCLTIPPLL